MTFETRRTVRQVDRVLLKHRERNDVGSAFVCGGEDDETRRTVEMGPQPVRRGNAPSIARGKTGEAILGNSGDEVVADLSLMFKELGGHDGTDRVAAEIFWAGRAATVAEESGERIETARLQLAAQDVPIRHRRQYSPRFSLVRTER